MRLWSNYNIEGTGLQRFKALPDVKFFHIMWGANLVAKAVAIIKNPIVSSE